MDVVENFWSQGRKNQGEHMSTFQAKVTEVSIYMDDLFVTTVSMPDKGIGATNDEAQLGDFHMSLFSLEEWDELSELIAKAVATVTEKTK
jgi:hypothetical protein